MEIIHRVATAMDIIFLFIVYRVQIFSGKLFGAPIPPPPVPPVPRLRHTFLRNGSVTTELKGRQLSSTFGHTEYLLHELFFLFFERCCGACVAEDTCHRS